MSDSIDQNALYPIREVARLTGINPITLRAWERRYNLIEPVRTESGHRLSSAVSEQQFLMLQPAHCSSVLTIVLSI